MKIEGCYATHMFKFIFHIMVK